MSEATEMATRLAEYDNARKGYTGVSNRLFGKERKPLSAREAALESRDITLDSAVEVQTQRKLTK